VASLAIPRAWLVELFQFLGVFLFQILQPFPFGCDELSFLLLSNAASAVGILLGDPLSLRGSFSIQSVSKLV